MMGCGLIARCSLMVLSLVCAMAWAASAPSDDVSGSAASRHAVERCKARHATVDACDDAIRWNPRDPALLVAMGDAQMRASRPADALRAYQRAAATAPAAGVQQKITKAENVLAKSKNSAARGVTTATGLKKFSNLDPETQSH